MEFGVGFGVVGGVEMVGVEWVMPLYRCALLGCGRVELGGGC